MKNQFKKSLSLIMAVLMLMSCWVWVAPEKAEAAAPTNYTLEMNFTVSDACNGGTVKADVTHVANNGTGSATTTTWNLDKCESDEGTYSLTKDFSGFPTKIVWSVSQGGMRTQEIKLNYFKINGTTILQGGWTLNPGWWGSGSKTMEKSGEVVGGDQGTPTVNSWPTPKLESASVSLSPASHTLARINSGTNSTSTITLSGHKDQYGVNWTGTITNTFTLRTDGDVNVGSYASSSGSGNSRTITIKPWFQTYFPAKQNTKLYIDWTTAGGSGKKTGTETITVDFPTYMATFHANGGKIGVDNTEAKDSIEYTGEKMNIGSVIGKAPAYATKTGFEFKGFYSTQNADATGKTTSFSGTLFEDDVTIIPAATSGNGDTNWYAAWQALPITATFMTADNQLIGTVEGRYNNYMTASNMYDGDAGLNAAVKASHTSGKVKFNNNNEPIYTDGSTSYTFAGWKIIKAYDESVMDKNEDTVLKGDVTFQAVYTKADATKYTVSFEDGAGNVISSKNDYLYRDQVTGVPSVVTKEKDNKYLYEFVGWAKDIGKNIYIVDESDKDENGATIVYTHKDGAEFIVKGNATYVPVFRMTAREYKVTFNYKVDGGKTESIVVEGYKWDENPVMPEGIKDNYTAGGFRYHIEAWTVSGDFEKKQLEDIKINGDMVITAAYGEGKGAEYTINFYDIDGNIINTGNNIYTHNTNVKVPTVGEGEGSDIPQKIDTEDSLYTFEGWDPEVKTTATADAEYRAQYTKKDYADIHFYNYDGTLIYELDGKTNGFFAGETIIPVYDEKTYGLPEKAEDPVGTYKFSGWKDSQGNVVVPGTDKFEGDTYLTAQFDTVYKEYTVKFLNDNGDVISEKKYLYATEIEVPAEPTKEKDNEYEYDFRAWTPDVSEVCYGDATYTATYRRSPRYYTVTWLNDAKAVHSTSNYKYNAKINQGVINAPVNYPDTAEGKTWAFKHWVQCDANGNDIIVDGKQVIFARGQKMPAKALYFYPVFEEVDNVLTVKFYKEDGKSYIGTAEIPYGREISDFDGEFKVKAPKVSDATNHYTIDKWVNVDGGADVTTITADVSVKATYTANAHDPKLYEVVAEPTCNVPGFGHYKCEADECTTVNYNVMIPVLPDTGAPSGTLYVGSAKWASADYAAIDYSEITFVSPSTQLIVNTSDKVAENETMSRGVGKIEYYVSETKIDNLTSLNAEDWATIYDYEAYRQEALNEVLKEKNITLEEYIGYNRGDMIKKAEIDRAVDAALATHRANATGVVSNLNLEDGKTYIIYLKVSDREGNGEVNTAYFSSGTISYGTTAAEITVSGDGYGSKFCKKANIRITDDADEIKAYLDGVEVETYTNPGTTSANGTFVATFETAEEGLHTVTVIDKHGNKTMKTFEISANHSYRQYVIAESCVAEGSRYDICTICGVKENEKVIPALGHSYTKNFTDKMADCINDGYRTYICDNNCGEKLVLKPTDDASVIAQAKKKNSEGEWVALEAADLAALKATGVHTYAKVKDEDGNDTAEDAWVIDLAPTCTVEGSKHKYCIKCGLDEARVTEVIPVDTVDGHKFYREKITKEPTCTEKGEKTKTCRYCGDVVVTEYIDALGHTEGDYRINIEPVCQAPGNKILTCSVCGVDIGTEYIEIPALGCAWKKDGGIQKVEDKVNGEIVTIFVQYYKCSRCGETKKEILEDYVEPKEVTVSFLNGDASFATIKKFVGESITAADVAAPSKDADATYTYIFSNWVDAEGKEVKFPIEVKDDATYTAAYTSKYINYTITYYTENANAEGGIDTKEYKKIGYIHNGEEITLLAGPSKAGNWEYTYKFAGWKDKATNTVYTDKVTIDGANINLVATYTNPKNNYAVTYAYSNSEIIETFTVEAGTAAKACDIVPVKKFDSKYHYEFEKWNKADLLANVQSNIYTTPKFTGIEHEFETKVITAETCDTNRVVIEKCKTCGYETEQKEVNGTKREHELGAPVVVNGVKVLTCTYEDCDYKNEDALKLKVKFYVSADAEKAIKTVDLTWGDKLEASNLPADPTQEQDAANTYKFVGWKIKGDTSGTIYTADNIATVTVEANMNFVAEFEGTARTYTVTFFKTDASEDGVLKVVKDVKAGSNVTYDLDIIPSKTFTKNAHYSFKGWKGYEAGKLKITVTNVLSDVNVHPEFTAIKHTATNEIELSAATCTEGKGLLKWCDCDGDGAYIEANDYHYIDGETKPDGHKYEPTENRVEATETTDGYQEMKCTVCGDTYNDPIKFKTNKITITVTVLHNGKAESGVKVEIQSVKNGSMFATTNANGVATFTVDKDDIYTCYVAENLVALNKNGDNLEGEYSYTDDADCTCACHRTNIWGTIFRFFHKIIKMFTKEFKCCGNPDPMYG